MANLWTSYDTIMETIIGELLDQLATGCDIIMDNWAIEGAFNESASKISNKKIITWTKMDFNLKFT